MSVDSLESVKPSRNANPSYLDISCSSDTCDGVSISPNGYDLSKAYVESSVMKLPVMISALFAVSIDTSLGLVQLQIASSTGCAANNSSTDRAGRNVRCDVSDTCASILAPSLGAVES